MAQTPTPKRFSLEEVQRHSREDDIWLIKDGKVFDLTPYYKSHPGGEAMLKYAGKDVTFVLRNVQAHCFSLDFIERKLAELCIGHLG
uniref:Cytochrome b5 heme-binding domain-containing protein n=1 Tax=Globodera rostochiensis TaxID=31243 RepID=A0A914HXR6_GLORO